MTSIQDLDDGLHRDIPMQAYLGLDAWSASDFKNLLDSPEFCHWSRTAKREERPPEKEAATFGTLSHVALLEPDAWPPADVKWIPGPYNRNPGKAEKTAWESKGFTVLSPDVRERVENLVRRAKEHPRVRDLLDVSDEGREVTAIATCPWTGLRLKARADILATQILTIADLKTTTAGVDRKGFTRTLKRFRYWMSAPHYLYTFSLALGVEFDTYLFVVCDQNPPHSTTCWQVDPVTMAAGEDLMAMLRRKAHQCEVAGAWPGPDVGIGTVGLTRFDLEEISGLIEEEAKNS